VSLTAPAAAPSNGQLGADLTFALDVLLVGNQLTTLNLTLTQEGTAANTSVADLVAGFNALLGAALTSAGLTSTAVSVSQVAGALVLTASEPSIVKLTVHGATVLGFGADQASVTTVALNATSDAPSNGRLPADLSLTLDLLTPTAGHDAPRHGDRSGHRGQHTLAQLVTDLQAALGAALTAAGFASSALAVTNDVGTLIVTAVEPSIVKLTIHNARQSASAPTRRRCAPATACSSSRTAATSATSCGRATRPAPRSCRAASPVRTSPLST